MRLDRSFWRWNNSPGFAGFQPRLKLTYERADQRLGGWLVIFQQSLRRFIEMRGLESAASMAYFALFSLFPLTLLLIALMGYVIDSETAYQQAVQSIRGIFPFSGEVLNQNLKEVVNMRGTFGVISVLFMLWSASGYFNTMVNAVNRAWPMVKLRSYVHNRLVAVAMIGLLLLLLLLSLASTALINLLPWLLLDSTTQDQVANSGFWQAVIRISAAVFTFLMFLSIYTWMPNKIVRWRAAVLGAAITALAWELAKTIFSVYLRSGLAAYRFLYGSLGALAALLFWVYLSSIIALFGAHLVATLDIASDLQTAPQKAEPGVQIFSDRKANPEDIRHIGSPDLNKPGSNRIDTPETQVDKVPPKRIRG